MHLEPRADRFRALRHDGEAQATRPRLFGVEAAAVIPNDQFERVPLVVPAIAQRHVGVLGFECFATLLRAS